MSEEENEEIYEMKKEYSINSNIVKKKLKVEDLEDDFSMICLKNKELFLKIKEINQFSFGFGDKHYIKYLKAIAGGSDDLLSIGFQKLKGYFLNIEDKVKYAVSNTRDLEEIEPEPFKMKEIKPKDVIGFKLDEEEKKIYFFHNKKKTTLFKNVNITDLYLFITFDESLNAKLVPPPKSDEDEKIIDELNRLPEIIEEEDLNFCQGREIDDN
jgi:hypothetical protein